MKASASSPTSLDQLCVNTIRFLSVDAVEEANSGHPGLPLGAAPMAYILWSKIMNYNPRNPAWYDRDRFILSAGHGSALLYSMLHLTGYDLSLDEVKKFRQLGSKTPGHPERGEAPGVEVSTGPLGQGFANGVGMAVAEAYLGAKYNRPGYEIIDHYIYAIVSDGDLMEGVASEAASLAGHLKLGKLIYLYDDNNITLSASTQLSFTEDRAARFEAYGWQTIRVEDGNDIQAIEDAIYAAQQDKERPSLILVRTHIGFGSPNKQDSFHSHGSPLGQEEVKLTKENLGFPTEPSFYIPQDAGQFLLEAVARGEKKEVEWNEKFKEYEKTFPELAKELSAIMEEKLPAGWDSDVKPFPADPKGMATRVASGKVLNMLAPHLPSLIGGSADLNPSTHTAIDHGGTFQSTLMNFGDRQGVIDGGWGFSGRNIQFGVREHAMGSMVNGMATYGGIIPYCATFLTFSDYMRPAIRLSSIMDLFVIYVFTHDSIALGEDGPTHQPVEHIASLRAIPHLIVIRPSDANETVVAWKSAIELHKKPVALILSRQNVPTLDREKFAPAEGLKKGAYVLADPMEHEPNFILIATGSEVNLIVTAQEKLAEQGVYARLVSMPSWELFEEQPQDYKESVFPQKIRARLSVEAGVEQGWERYVGDFGGSIAIDRFGASAPGDILMKQYGFSVENIVAQAIEIMKKQK